MARHVHTCATYRHAICTEHRWVHMWGVVPNNVPPQACYYVVVQQLYIV